MKDPYVTLGVSRSATPEEIKSAYRSLAKKHHPDQGGDEEKFKEISAAYERIKDGKKQQDFNIFDQPFTNVFNDEDFMNIFRQGKTRQNTNIKATVDVTLESILKFNTLIVQINSKEMEIKIPAGIHDGATILYKGMGNNTNPNQPPGDLLIEINILPHPKFQRKGDDLYSEITIDCFDAIKGKQIDFFTLSKKQLRVTIPKGCQHGTTLRIAKEGLPSIYEKSVGNLYIKINISVPTKLSKKQLELIEEIISLNTN